MIDSKWFDMIFQRRGTPQSENGSGGYDKPSYERPVVNERPGTPHHVSGFNTQHNNAQSESGSGGASNSGTFLGMNILDGFVKVAFNRLRPFGGNRVNVSVGNDNNPKP